MTFVELYAGMAAVSWGCFGAVPPVCYQGGKRGYQADIRQRLGLERPSRIVLVEHDPYVADALRVVWSPALRGEAVALIESWVGPDEEARARWERYRVEAHDGQWAQLPLVERGARWLWMRPRTVPFQLPPKVCRGNWQRSVSLTGRTRNWTPCTPADKLRKLPIDLPPVEIVTGKAEDVEPIRGATVYLDPPYPGTSGYRGNGPTWEGIARLALRWEAAGCRVGVSVQVPVGLRCYSVAWSTARKRHYGNTREFLTVFERPPATRRRSR